ncbi:diguanylate cyclase [Paraburkholderia acidipaludis]|uniref:diguanylate cyclase n=1 Tax=Paraburkholderia acidipaludis TaxID=660537 RepID=UPI000A0491F7|nr:diguanylate cyclase [Paraburkholderia acidipaludis]
MDRTADPSRQTAARTGRRAGIVSRIVMKCPRLIVTLCFGCAMVLVAVVGVRQLYLLTRHDLESRQRDLEVRAAGVNALIASESRRLLFLRDYAQHVLASIPEPEQPHNTRPTHAAPLHPAPAATSTADSDTSLSTWEVAGAMDGPPVFGTNAAGLYGLKGFRRDDTTLPADLVLARQIGPLLAISQNADAVERTAAFISSNGLYVISPQRPAANVEAMFRRFEKMPYYRGQLPDSNTSHDVVWTPVYTEFQQGESIATLSAPVYVRGRFRGVVLMDVTPSRLLALQRSSGVLTDDETDADFALFNSDGNAIYFHNGNMIAARPASFTDDLLQAAHTSAGAWLRDGRTTAERGGHYLIFQRIGDTQWGLASATDNVELTLNAAKRVFSSPLIVAWLALAVLLFGTLRVVNHIFGRYVEASVKLAALARSDPLTGLANRRSFDETFARAIAHAARAPGGPAPIAVLMIDIDFFKHVNDRWGHAAGDRVLEILADIMRTSLRTVDVPARLGGEEFAALLPDADRATAAAVGERLRRAVETHAGHAAHTGSAGQPDAARPETIPFSISIGVAASPEDGPAASDALMAAADRRLYRAKESGRNRVVSDDTARSGPVKA